MSSGSFIRAFQLSNVVYHDDLRLERLMNISGYLRDIGSANESDVELMKKNIGIYIAFVSTCISVRCPVRKSL